MGGPTPVPQPDLQERYDDLVRRHRAAFQRLARRLARDPEDAEDLLQETLLDAYRAFPSFRPDSQFYSWVARIMTNNYLDRVRRKHHTVVPLDSGEGDGTGPLELPDDSTNPERLLLHEQFEPELQAALDALQPVQRTTVFLCDLAGATYEEAARAESCPIGTIRSRLHRAHRAIRDFLANLEQRADPGAACRLQSRRSFLFSTAAAAGAALTQLGGTEEASGNSEPIRVLVRADETAPREVYPQGLREAIASALRGCADVQVRVLPPEEAPSAASLRDTDVLVWWGIGPVPPDTARLIARRVRHDGMGFVALHSAHDSLPFRLLMGVERPWNGRCCPDGSPVEVRVTAPRHPVAREIASFRIPQTERYEGELELPTPDVIVFDGTYPATATGSRQGLAWRIGRGRVFYFQPGHETYPIYHQEEVRRVLRNAVRWCAGRPTS